MDRFVRAGLPVFLSLWCLPVLAEEAAVQAPSPTQALDDHEPPVIEDLAVAAINPDAPPMFTAIFTDDYSGVERAEVYFRTPSATTYSVVAFTPGQGGLFLARLPDGVQKEGFAYYVEVWDAARNGPTRLGSPEAPLSVAPAVESTTARMAREERARNAGKVHPGIVMGVMGAGIVLGAASGLFWYDLANVVEPAIAAREAELASAALSESRRAELEASRDSLLRSRSDDLLAGSLLAAGGGVALISGVVLLAVSANSE